MEGFSWDEDGNKRGTSAVVGWTLPGTGRAHRQSGALRTARDGGNLPWTARSGKGSGPHGRGEEAFDGVGELLDQALVELAAGRRCEARMHRAHPAVAAKNERGRPGVEVFRLRQPGGDVLGLTGDEVRILHAILA